MSFFFNDTATTENYTLSLHGALPISTKFFIGAAVGAVGGFAVGTYAATPTARSVGQSALGGLDVSLRYLGRTVVQAVDGLGDALESGYTRVRGREIGRAHV